MSEYKYAKYKHKYLQSKAEQFKSEQNGGSVGNLNVLTTSLFSHLIMIKMLHFQTQRYGSHKALDDYYDTFNKKMDQLLEVLQGRYGRINMENGTVNLNVALTNDDQIREQLDRFENQILKGLIDQKYSDLGDVISIRDEMVAELEQLKYLLDFK